VEERTLVLVFRPPAAGSDNSGVDDYSASVAIGLCQTPGGAGFFAEGRALRVQVRDDGRSEGSATIRTCPGREVATRILASSIQRRAGQRFGTLTLTGARAEGTELVILIDGPSGWRRGYSPEQINILVFRGYCRNPDTHVYFDGTRTVRIDTLENGGQVRRGPPIASCAPYLEG
jgi:hypothetical protein